MVTRLAACFIRSVGIGKVRLSDKAMHSVAKIRGNVNCQTSEFGKFVIIDARGTAVLMLDHQLGKRGKE